ncbi:MAG TPA: hypothetical protein VK009_00420 [Chloroflexota bacterium]|nr:hypothetical protein [Chloroflexota bacterium]
MADNGHTVQVRVGQKVNVGLTDPPGFGNWVLTPSNPNVLRPTVNPGATAALGTTLAAFLAVAAGQSVIQGTSSCNTAGCTGANQTYSATVTVLPAA